MKCARLFLVGLIFCSACAHADYKRMTAVGKLTPFPTPTAMFKTYAVGVLGSSRAPVLSSVQRRWIQRVTSSRTYGRLRLRFALLSGVKTPIVVYVDRSDEDGADRGGHVIGERCNVYFDPVEHGLFPASEASCTPPTPKPVI